MNNHKEAAQSLTTHLETHKKFNQDIEQLMKNVDVLEKINKIKSDTAIQDKIAGDDQVHKDANSFAHSQLTEEYSKLLIDLKIEDWKNEFNNALLKQSNVDFINSQV